MSELKVILLIFLVIATVISWGLTFYYFYDNYQTAKRIERNKTRSLELTVRHMEMEIDAQDRQIELLSETIFELQKRIDKQNQSND